MKRYALPLLLLPQLLPLSALANDAGQPYACDNGSSINISFSTASDGRPQATLHFADSAAITLPQVPAASGVLYRADDIRLHTQADEAVFEDGQGNPRRCKQGRASPLTPVAAKPALSSFLDINGSVSYRQRIALPPDAVLTVRIQDVSRAGAPARVLAEQRMELAGRQVPILFQTTIDRDLIGKKARITASARIERGGKLLFISDKSYPVLSGGQALPLEINLKQASSGQPR